MRDSWAKMFKQLDAFKAHHEHCRVPANCAENPSLGRWVAAQRYKKKIGALPEDLVAKLDSLDFLWVPADESWQKLFKQLVAFKKKYGHCSVPEHWPKNQSLANWVQSHRFRKKRGKLSAERVKELDKLGFTWAIYKCGDDNQRQAGPLKEKKDRVRHPEALEENQELIEVPGEKLYAIRGGVYCQFNSDGPMPRELQRYAELHRGNLPPYIPLPSGPTTFLLGDGPRGRKIKWTGKGPLPVEVLEYVKNHDTLPRYS